MAEVFLIKRIPAWSRNLSNRAIGTAKLAFVQMELARQATWSDSRAEIFRYRTKDKVEVDVILRR